MSKYLLLQGVQNDLHLILKYLSQHLNHYHQMDTLLSIISYMTK